MYLLLFILPLASALNILMSSTDSWVSKNPRYLYRALADKGHNVMYVGPLYAHNNNKDSSLEKRDDGSVSKRSSGGDFGHLMDASQQYYKNYRKINSVTRGAKNVIRKKELEAFDAEFGSQNIVAESFLGQDPLNRDFWYVAGTPLEALSLAFSEILPKHVPSFVPDLVLIGPNEGLHLSSCTEGGEFGFLIEDLANKENQVDAMTQLANLHQYPVISASVQDEDDIYYEDEDYFNIEEPKYDDLFRDNAISQNVKFVNNKISKFVDDLAYNLDVYVSVNINFPSLNHKESTCFTRGTAAPDFVQVTRPHSETGAYGKILSIPEVRIQNELVTSGEELHFKVSEELKEVKQIRLVEQMRMKYLMLNEVTKENKQARDKYENLEEIEALQNCQIAVSVNHLTRGNNLDRFFLDIEH